jgi:hypothetical protein
MGQCQQVDGAVGGHDQFAPFVKNVFISLIYDFIRQFSTLIANKLTAKFISRWADRRFI